MFDRPCAFRVSAYLISLSVATTGGCAARPLPPPKSYASTSGEVPSHRFSAMPHVTTDDQPIRFVGLTSADREAFEKERAAFEKARQERIEYRANATRVGSEEKTVVQCMFGMFIIFSPLCLFWVPAHHGFQSTVERGKASRAEPYLPSLPSDEELSRVEQKIKLKITAQGVARQLSRLSDSRALYDRGFPRVLIRAESATFTPDRMITIKVVVQAEVEAGVTWPPTEHLYHLGYVENGLDSGLNDAEASLAASISSTYSR